MNSKEKHEKDLADLEMNIKKEKKDLADLEMNIKKEKKDLADLEMMTEMHIKKNKKDLADLEMNYKRARVEDEAKLKGIKAKLEAVTKELERRRRLPKTR